MYIDIYMYMCASNVDEKVKRKIFFQPRLVHPYICTTII